jgi:hypothetical protein
MTMSMPQPAFPNVHPAFAEALLRHPARPPEADSSLCGPDPSEGRAKRGSVVEPGSDDDAGPWSLARVARTVASETTSAAVPSAASAPTKEFAGAKPQSVTGTASDDSWFADFLRKTSSVPREADLSDRDGIVFRPADGFVFTQASGEQTFGAAASSSSVTPFGVSSDPLTAIDWGTKLATTVVDVYFAPAGTYIDGVGDFGPAQGFTLYERQQILSALDQVAAVTNLSFRVTTTQAGAEFRLGTFHLDAYDAIAFMVPPGEPYAGFMGFDPDYLRWLDGESGNPLLSRGGFMYAVLLEELGHGLGMAHPHDEGGTSTILEGVTAPVGSYGVGDLNQGVYTMMGYTEGWPAGPYGDQYFDGTYIYVNDFGYEATPMALDVAVLQSKYGANLGHAIGDDVYSLPEGNGMGAFFTCIWDAGGTDRLQYGGAQDANIDLRPATLLGEAGGGGYISSAAGIRGGFTIAAGVVIEQAMGGWGNDRITGNGAANLLAGNEGDDWLLGGAGDDTIEGGDGNDLLCGDLGSPEEVASLAGLLDRIAQFAETDAFAF